MKIFSVGGWRRDGGRGAQVTARLPISPRGGVFTVHPGRSSQRLIGRLDARGPRL
jgi:hypothetical protein